MQLNSVETDEQNINDALMNRLTNLIDKLEQDKQDALDNMNQIQERQKDRHNDQRVSERLKIGEKVLVEKTWKRRDMSAKLEAQWIGPYYIHDIIGFNNYKLRSLDGRIVKGTVHGDRLKKYNEQRMEPRIEPMIVIS